MFHLIKTIVLIIGCLTIAYFSLGYFGYEVNQEYFNYSKEKCEQEIRECTAMLLNKDQKENDCHILCVDPKLIIKKK